MSGEAVRAALEEIAAEDLEARCRGVARLAAVPGTEATEALAQLLEESSWYLRERVAEALVGRAGAEPFVTRVLREGSWFARASACDVIGGSGDLSAVGDLLAQVQDRNVSLQKSATRALGRLAEVHGTDGVARGVASLSPERRRRVVARVGHQEPRWARELEAALSRIPAAEKAGPDQAAGGGERVAPARSGTKAAERALVRFRRWLFAAPREGEGS